MKTLTCTAGHDSRQPIGATWSMTPGEDDAICLKCHQKYEPARERFRHTRHQGGTAGARCLNGLMPRRNEGLQEVVRAHATANPTRPSMIEVGRPNARNLCHFDKSIDWPITWLSRW